MYILTNCVKRQYVVPRKLFNSSLKYNAKSYLVNNAKLPNINLNNEMNRLCLPVLHRLYRDLHMELNTVQQLVLKNKYGKIQCFPSLCNTRTFSTSSSNHNANNEPSKDPKKEKDSNKHSKDDPKKRMGNLTDDQNLIFQKFLTVTAVLSLMLYILLQSKDTNNHISGISWNEFLHDMLEKGEVNKLIIDPATGRVIITLHNNAIIRGKRSFYKTYFMTVPDVKGFEEKVRQAEQDLGIKLEDRLQIVYDRSSENILLLSRILLIVFIAIPLMALWNKRSMRNPFDIFSQIKRAKYTLVEPRSSKGVRFEDVAGLKEAKVEVMEFVDYLKNPQRYKTLGAKVPKGALLLGPPGCGKTLLAKAVATESNVPFLSMNGSEFVEMLGGVGAARVRNLFKDGRNRAPSIIYIDEIDAIGRKRTGESRFGNSESERTLIQLLVEMDGMTTEENIIVLASTNRADMLDKALLRPGRFDRHILIDFPNLEERRQIFETHLKVLSLQDKPARYSEYLAQLTAGFSGADIANVCNEAALHAARFKKTKVDGNDLTFAVDKKIGGLAKKTSAVMPATKKVIAYHEAGQVIATWLLEHTEALLQVSIVPRTNMRLGYSRTVRLEKYLLTQEQLFQKLCVMLAGRVAEYIIFDKISTTAESDLAKATKLAYQQVQQYGMSPTVGLISFDQEATSTRNKKPYSKKLGNIMDAEVRRIIGEAYSSVEKLLRDNQDKLVAIAEALMEKETLNYDDVEKLIGPPPFPKQRVILPVDFESFVTKPESEPVEKPSTMPS